jgi:peptide/nickel transport system permease protein
MTEATETRGRSLWGDAWRRLRRNGLAMTALVVIVLYTAIAAGAQVAYLRSRVLDRTPAYNVNDFDARYQPPSLRHPLGTDGLGRDVLMRTIQGARIAFVVGIGTSLVAIPIAVVLGALAGYFGGRLDDFIVWLYSTFASIPGLLLILAVSMVLRQWVGRMEAEGGWIGGMVTGIDGFIGEGLLAVCLGIGLTTWVGLSRLIRAEFIKHRERPYVLAVRSLGAGHARVMFVHILPNVFHLVIINFSLRFGRAIMTEVILSFLGIGAQGEPSWGILISNAKLRLWQGVWWEMAAPSVAIFLVVLAFNVFGDALRDALDPRLRGVSEA